MPSADGHVIQIPRWTETGVGSCLIDTFQIVEIQIHSYDADGVLTEQLLGMEDQINFSWDETWMTVYIDNHVDVHRVYTFKI